MKRKLLLVFLVLFVIAGCASPPRPRPTPVPPPPPAQSPAEICAKAGKDLKVNIDGSWTCQSAAQTEVPTPKPVVQPPAQAPLLGVQLVNRHTQTCMTMTDRLIVLTSCGSGSNQMWDTGSGNSFQLKSATGSCAGYVQDHAELVRASCSASPVLTMKPYGPYAGVVEPMRFPHPHPTARPIETGTYFQLSSGDLCVDDESWSHNDGVVILDGCRGQDHDNQLWAKH